MPERKKTGILSMNVKKLINLQLVWNTVRNSKIAVGEFVFHYTTKCKLINFFTFKDKIPVFLHSIIVYKFRHDG